MTTVAELPPLPIGPGASAVSIQGVGKRFGSVRALDDVSFEVGSGSVHGLLGPNGAGKTTVLRMMFGLVRPDRGRVRVNGRSPFGAPGAALRGVAGFVESPKFYPYLSATRNLDLLSSYDGSSSGAAVDEVLAAVGLARHARAKVAGYSTGMRQRLGIAAALLRDPHLLILDEPTNGLDPNGLHELHDLIRAVAASGRTVVLSSHDMGEIEQLCESVTILDHGQVAFTGTLEALRADAPAPRYLLATSDDAAAQRCVLELLPTADPATDSAADSAAQFGPQGLVVHAHQHDMDQLMLALAERGVAVRRLVRLDTALEAMFLRLTADAGHCRASA